MDFKPQFVPKVLKLYLEISQYPILGKTIRKRMRDEIFRRGVITPEDFENEVIEKAQESQRREGLVDPFGEESPADWEERTEIIRANLTYFYFAYNLQHSLFEEIVQDLLQQRVPDHDMPLSFNPEIAPLSVLFQEGEMYERLADNKQIKVQHHLREIKAVLIKAMISDHLNFVRLAREAFTIADLRKIHQSRIGRGKIGGKAAGMLLAWKLLQRHAPDYDIDPEQIVIPASHYIGSDVVYEVHTINDFYPFMNQKYKSQEDIRDDYPSIFDMYTNAKLPAYVMEQLAHLLENLGNQPLILRSSSLLEDSFDTSFAGKYDSFFLPNQGTLEQNLADMKTAILKIYASIFTPDALIYRERMGLIDFDERMAILIQPVAGDQYGTYFFPTMAGVGFSRNPFRWTSRIRREDGLLRLVCGLGTRAVDRVANDYPRMIALSHPRLRPEKSAAKIRQYSQHLIDVIDLEQNTLSTLPISEVIGLDFPGLRLVASYTNDGLLQPFISRPSGISPNQLVFNFKQLIEKTQFATIMRCILACLQEQYQRPVDIEYAVDIEESGGRPRFKVILLQCRPLSQHEVDTTQKIPVNLSEADKIFSAHRLVPQGIVERIRYVVMVKPAYNQLVEPHARLEVGRIISRLNEALASERFILMGPGRWGSSNVYLGVKVSYSDIYNSRALIEIAMPDESGGMPEMAYGTHFFQDLVESKIFPLALFPSEPDTLFNWAFFDEAPNLLPDLLPQDADWVKVVTVIDVAAEGQGRLLEIIMSADEDEALAYLKDYAEQ